MEEIDMREEYDIKALNPRKNPYAQKIKKPVTMNMNVSTIEYFKALSDESGIPYQILMNYYLDDCVKQKKKLQFVETSKSAQ
ncbi:MAG: antitoxin [Ruminococcus sp.]|nr:antitoxin [Ruminococcus sp.]MCM1156394.1 antitoxin [Roseburia sp.]